MKIILSILIIVALGWVIWRYASTRYNLPCPAWLSWMVEMDNPFTKVNRAESIIRHLDISPNMDILDIGCGPGRLTIPIAKLLTDGKIVAMDMQQSMLDKVRKKADRLNLKNISYLNAKLEEGNNQLADNQFDRILLVTVLGEIPDHDSAFQAIYQTLKPGGLLSVTEIIFDPHFQRQKSVLKLAQKQGFQQQAIFGNYIAYTMHLQKPSN